MKNFKICHPSQYYFYLFEVKDNLDQHYYTLNNGYIGYIGFDSDDIRRSMEHHGYIPGDTTGLKTGRKLRQRYRLFARGVPKPGSHRELHALNCSSIRFNLEEAKLLAKDHGLTRCRAKTWYEVYSPNPNSSKCYLREIREPGDKHHASQLKTIQ